MDALIEQLSDELSEADAQRNFSALQKIFNSISEHPKEESFRHLERSKLQDKLHSLGFQILEADNDNDDEDAENLQLHQLRLVEAKLRQREEELEAQGALQHKKLVTASKALERTRLQLRQLTDQLEVKEHCRDKFNTQADALQLLLVEKERRLMAALVEVESSLEGDQDVPPRQQPQEGPVTKKEGHGEQLMQLASMTEKLTDALDMARDSEEDARKQLALLIARMQQNRDQRSAYEQELEAVMREEHVEIAALQTHLQTQEQNLSWERVRIRELALGDVIKKGDPNSFLHMEV